MMLPNEVRLGQPCLLPLDELADDFWPELETKLPKLRAIIADHFGSACATFDLIGEGAYARVYGVTLQSGVRLAARIGLPVRPGVKTEAEVATMEFVRGSFCIHSDQNVTLTMDTSPHICTSAEGAPLFQHQ